MRIALTTHNGTAIALTYAIKRKNYGIRRTLPMLTYGALPKIQFL